MMSNLHDTTCKIKVPYRGFNFRRLNLLHGICLFLFDIYIIYSCLNPSIIHVQWICIKVANTKTSLSMVCDVNYFNFR